MPQLTQRELLYLKDAIDSEALMVEKFNTLAENATDSEVERICRDVEQTHRAHQQTLTQYLNQVSNTTQ